MYEYTKEILTKVSFDRALFKKELKKAVRWLKIEERHLLQAWCITTFGAIYQDVIAEVFKSL